MCDRILGEDGKDPRRERDGSWNDGKEVVDPAAVKEVLAERVSRAKQLIEQYFNQLTEGCGREKCCNENCKSSGMFTQANLTPETAAIKAFDLLKKNATLCDCHAPRKVSKNDCVPSCSTSESEERLPNFLTLDCILQLIERGKTEGWKPLIRTIGNVFRFPEKLLQSFCVKSEDGKTSSDLDLPAVHKAMDALFSIPELPFQDALIQALIALAPTMDLDIKYQQATERHPSYLNIVKILLEIPVLHSPEFLDAATPSLCRVLGSLPLSAQVSLVRAWSNYGLEQLNNLVVTLQQLITVKVVSESCKSVNICYDERITGAVKLLKMIFYACMLAGQCDSAAQLASEHEFQCATERRVRGMMSHSDGASIIHPFEWPVDALSAELGLRPIDCRQPALAWPSFVNECLMENVVIEKDYQHLKSGNFSYLLHPFLLTTTKKHLGLYLDSRTRMDLERRNAVLQSLTMASVTQPFLRLHIRRDHVIDDALVTLDLIAKESPEDLKKQLYVEFAGEDGLDEGGVSKEFFQLVIEELFNPDYAMFVYNGETRDFWFNSESYESEAQFTLVGILLGLAIYNNVILNVQFPLVVYRKLLGKLGSFADLQELHPTIWSSLNEMLSCKEEENFRETFMQNFEVGYNNMFGNFVTSELKENGANIPVTMENRREFVDLYVDFLLNKSIERQFQPFLNGFLIVTNESPLKFLFRPEEVDELVAGSKNFDFYALERATEYDSGFTRSSQTIVWFWQIVHSMSDEQKKQLLQFATGSDRVPVGGLAKLRLIIAKNGGDTERLPTSHTCFNVLLLPEYATKEKLENRVLLAITHAKGFGML